MKRLIILIALSALLGGCAWFQRSDKSSGADSGTIGGPDIGPGRGTTGVSSGAQGGSGITGSDLAPP
jgi:hypothetical protein